MKNEYNIKEFLISMAIMSVITAVIFFAIELELWIGKIIENYFK